MRRKEFYECNFDLVGADNEGSFDSLTQFMAKLVQDCDDINFADLLPLMSAIESAASTIADVLRTSVAEELKLKDKTITERVDEIFLGALVSSGSVIAIAAESKENIVQGSLRGCYIGYQTSLDEEKNIRRGSSCGFIFAFAKCPKKLLKQKSPLKDSDVLLTGEHIKIAGYILFGCSTELVLAVKDQGLHQFTLEPNLGLFMLTGKNIEVPLKAEFYFQDGGNSSYWCDRVTQILTTKLSLMDRHLSYFNPGGFVPILHAIVKTGGIYMRDEHQVPLLYCANPMAFIMHEGNGVNMTGDSCDDVLKMTPRSLHMKVGIFLGSKIDMELARDMFLDRVVVIGS